MKSVVDRATVGEIWWGGTPSSLARQSVDPHCESRRSDQKLATLHHLFAIEPDTEVAPDAIDVRFRFPICAGMLGIRMAKCDMHAGNFFILQNIADHSRAGRVRSDGEFAHAIAVLIGA